MRDGYKAFVCLLLAGSLAGSLHAQQPPLRFEHITTEQGLSQNSVNCIFQDRTGFLWIGTQDGLHKYDGYQFTVYRHNPDEPGSLSNDLVHAIYEDQAGALWIGTYGGGLNRFDRRTETFLPFKHSPGDSTSLSGDRVSSIYEDRAGALWVGTWNGLNRFDRETASFSPFTQDFDHPDNPPVSNNIVVRSIYEDETGLLWVGSEIGGLYRLDRDARTITVYRNDPDAPNSLSSNHVTALHEDRRGVLWIGTQRDGLKRFDKATGTATSYRHDTGDPSSLSADYVQAIYEDGAGALWVGTEGGGLNRFDRATGAFTRYTNDRADPHSLSSNRVTSIFEDRSGVLWVGTYGGGLNKYHRERERFTLYRHDPANANSLNDYSVHSIFEDRAGVLWVGTWHGGLTRFDRAANRFTHYVEGIDSLRHYSVRSIYEDATSTLWIGTDGRGLYQFDRTRQTFTPYLHPTEGEHLWKSIWQIYEDRVGTLWIASNRGLGRIDGTTRRITRYMNDPQGLTHNHVRAIAEDASGALWIGTRNGLNRFDRETETFARYRHDPQDPGSLSDHDILSIHIDKTGTLWIGTQRGLNRLVATSETAALFRRYRTAGGLPNEVIYGILEDDAGRLWMSTNQGLSHFDPETETFRNYDVSDGLQSQEFNRGAFFKSRRGELFFGGINGLNAFFPDSIRLNLHVPPVVITAVRKLDEAVVLKGASVPEIALSYADKYVSFEYAALDYANPSKHRYAYWLDGFDEAWIEAGARRLITYTNLDPGAYVFRVKGSNNDGIWNEEGAALRLTVHPPWWRAGWAYGMYVLLLIGGIVAAARFQRAHVLKKERERSFLREKELRAEAAEAWANYLQADNERKELELDKARELETAYQVLEEQAHRLEELDRTKSRFFANISHEFRTPLTLTLGPLENILSGVYGVVEKPVRAQLAVMHRSARRLLRLINQLLDLSKLEAGRMPLRAQHGNLVPFLKGIVHSFSSYAERKQLTLQFAAASETILLAFDPDKLEKIIANLLSNAIKFTPGPGTIRVTVSVPPPASDEDEAGVEIRVKDSGPGIPEEERAAIFDRFHQVDDSPTRTQGGTGIGLALTKELVELHGGTISVESEVGFGSTFTIRIPLIVESEIEKPDEATVDAEAQTAAWLMQEREETIEEETAKPSSQADQPAPLKRSDLPLLLIVEDHADVRAYLRGCLEAQYRIEEAEDGVAGLEKARTLMPDLIITDVMMPRMDGHTFCRHVKADKALNHIPVIMLTAKASEESKIEGLLARVDDYLYKPFNAQELQARVANLIAVRRLLQERYRRDLLLQASEVSVQSAGDLFISEARTVVERHLDEALDIDTFAHEMHLEKRQLQRKLKDLTGQTPTEFILTIRLSRAKQLLDAQAGSVSEIAYDVGFNSASYFTKRFRERFGLTPSEYARRA